MMMATMDTRRGQAMAWQSGKVLLGLFSSMVLILLLLAASAAIASSPAAAAAAVSEASGVGVRSVSASPTGLFSLTLVHTGSTFTQVTAVDGLSNPCEPINGTYVSKAGAEPCLGGMDRRQGLINEVRSYANNTLLVDVGSIFTHSLFWIVYNSTVTAPYYRTMGYDAVSLSIYEFITELGYLASFSDYLQPQTRLVASNIYNVSANPSLANVSVAPYVVIEYAGGERVAYTSTLVNKIGSLFRDPGPINSFDELSAMLAAVGTLQNMGVNKIIASISSKDVFDSVIPYVPGIDVVILPDIYYATNDTSTLDPMLPEPEPPAAAYPQVRQMPWSQPLLIVGSDAYGRGVGVLNLTFDANGVVVGYQGNSVQLSSSVPSDPATYARVQADYTGMVQALGDTIGYTATTLEYQDQCVFGECAIGDWSVGALRDSGGTQIGLFNGGSIYGSLPTGRITLGEILQVFPFSGSNQLWTLSLDGYSILQALEHSVSLANDTTLGINADIGRFFQVSGLNFTWNPNEPVGWRVVDVWVEETPGRWAVLDYGKTYSITTLDFTVNGGDQYTVFKDKGTNIVNTGFYALTPIQLALERTLPSNGGRPLDVTVDGRISMVTNMTRKSCLSDPSNGTSICSGNGYCLGGACVCTVQGVEPPLCSPDSQSSSDALAAGAIAGIVVGVAVPIAALFVALLLITLWALAYARRKAALTDDDWAVDMIELQLGDMLGKGGYGEVYKAVWKGTDVAVKRMNQGSVTKAMVASFTEEARVMSKLRHPNVVLFMAACIKPPNLSIVMEFMQLGSLFDLLHNELIADIPLQLRVKLAHQAAKGMHFLHSSDIVHRDLKSLNLLIDSKWNLKVADFGLTSFKESVKSSDQTVGSVHWMAPEVLSDQPNANYALADVYSFGIILWELLTRQQPYEGMTPPQIAIEVIRSDMRPSMPEEEPPIIEAEIKYMELMVSCWKRDPTDRPTFDLIIGRLESVVSGASGSSSGGFYSNGSASSSSSSSSSAYGSSMYSQHRKQHHGDNHGRSSALVSDYASASTSSSEDAGLVEHYRRNVPRHNVSYAVCDLALMDRAWQADPTGAERTIERYSLLVREHAKANGAHVFSTASLHSGGTFMLAFRSPKSAADFALSLLAGTQRDDKLREISRIALHYSPGANMHLMGDHTKSTYDPRNYEEACRINVLCPPAAVLCSLAFGRACDGLGIALSQPLEGSFVRLAAEPQEIEAGKATSADPLESSLCSSNTCPWIVDSGRLTVGDWIGEGTYGQVHEGSYLGRRVAVKRLFNSRLSEDTMRHARREAALLFDMDHPNLVKLMGLSIADGDIMLVMELVEGGNLRQLLAGSRKLSWEKRLSMLRDAAVALSVLHSCGIVHRDIKSSNLLVDHNDDGVCSVKVADFGFATIKADNATMTRCGTPAWTAPEVLLPSSNRGEAPMLEKADVYSLGIVMWEVLTRKVPYHDEPDHNLVNLIERVLSGSRPTIPHDAPEAFAKLMQRCWHRKPRKRPSMDEVVVALNGMMEQESSSV